MLQPGSALSAAAAAALQRQCSPQLQPRLSRLPNCANHHDEWALGTEWAVGSTGYWAVGTQGRRGTAVKAQ